MDIDVFAFDATSAALLVGVFVPLLVEVVTKRFTSAQVKTITNIVASTLLGGLVYLVGQDGDYDWRGFVNGALNVLLISLASFLGWKGIGMVGQDGALTRALPNFGWGTPGTAGVPVVEVAAPEETVTPVVVPGEPHETGRQLASERDDLIAAGADPADLAVPLAPGQQNSDQAVEQALSHLDAEHDEPPKSPDDPYGDR